MNQLMCILCDEDKICVIISAARLPWRDMMNNDVPQQQRFFADCALTMLRHKHGYPIVIQFRACPQQRSWADQAKMRANRTAANYNNYILKNSYVWSGNIPDDIMSELKPIE